MELAYNLDVHLDSWLSSMVVAKKAFAQAHLVHKLQPFLGQVWFYLLVLLQLSLALDKHNSFDMRLP